MPSKSFDFDMILSGAMLKFSMDGCSLCAHQEFHHGINTVSLQKTFQPSMAPLMRFPDIT